MPYQKSPEKLEELVKQVLNDPEISEGLTKSKIDEPALHRAIQKDHEEIWSVVSGETTQYDAAEYRLQSELDKLANAVGPEPSLEITKPIAPEEFPNTLLAIGIVGLIVTLAAGSWLKGFSGTLRWLFNYPVGVVVLVLLVLLLGGSRLLNLYFERRRLRLIENADESLRKAKEKWTSDKAAREEDMGINRIRGQLEDLQSTISQSLIEKKIKPKIRFLINVGLESSYDKDFHIVGASGLAEVFDPSHSVDTSAKQRLRFMLENTAGGSIGIAGPRGAGKTTLILSYCGPGRTVETLKGRPLLSVLASAPVEYQGRDFILYLFSAVSRCVLDVHGESEDPGGLQEANSTVKLFTERVLKFIERFSKEILSVGGGLILLSIILAGLFAKYPPPSKSTNEQKPAAVSNGQQAPPSTEVAPAPAEPVAIRFLKAMEINPSSLFFWGLVICLIRWSPEILQTGKPKVRTEGQPEAETAHESKPIPTLVIPDEKTRRRILDDSRKWLRKIKFQQSYTTGWSGALKLPVGLEGGVNSAVTLAENQLSLPEIVSSFTGFLTTLSKHYQVIIGIDELDKLESDDKAQRFLNEIKSIFGLERCFYLISVSENAMSSFERRGLPFRDAFDSSFDNIIYVDYLTFGAAQRLLVERVTGKPMPFFALSYCLAGGLPRDLIRHFRHLVELSERQGTNGARPLNDLTTLCREMVSADLRAKIRAVGLAAKRLEFEPEAGEFLETLYRLDAESPKADEMLKVATDMLCPLALLDAKERDAKLIGKRDKLMALKSELAVYSFYLATLLEFFNNDLTEATLKPEQAEGKGLDKLARARQVLAVDPDISFSLINRFRQDLNLSALPELPKTPVLPTPAPASPINNTAAPVA